MQWICIANMKNWDKRPYLSTKSPKEVKNWQWQVSLCVLKWFPESLKGVSLSQRSRSLPLTELNPTAVDKTQD